MGFLETLEERATAVGGTIALAEGDDPRVMEAAADLAAREMCRVVALCPAAGRRDDHRKLERVGVEIVDPADDPRRDELITLLHQRRARKGMTEDEEIEHQPERC